MTGTSWAKARGTRKTAINRKPVMMSRPLGARVTRGPAKVAPASMPTPTAPSSRPICQAGVPEDWRVSVMPTMRAWMPVLTRTRAATILGRTSI